MRGGIDSDDMGVRSHLAIAELRHCRTVHAKHRHDARFARNLERAWHGIERQHARIASDIERADELHGAHIQDEQRVVAFACDERETLPRLDEQSVVTSCPWQIDPRDDRVGRRVDFDELPLRLDVGENVL